MRHLLDLGADPTRRDGEYAVTTVGGCRHHRDELAVFGEHLPSAHRQVETLLEPLTDDG